MTQTQAQEQVKSFFKGIPMLTFSVREYPDGEWVAQCNEVDSIITTGKGTDMEEMQNLMQDAILTAAAIPTDVAEGLLKRVWASNNINTPIINTEMDLRSSLRLFPTTYKYE